MTIDMVHSYDCNKADRELLRKFIDKFQNARDGSEIYISESEARMLSRYLDEGIVSNSSFNREASNYLRLFRIRPSDLLTKNGKSFVSRNPFKRWKSLKWIGTAMLVIFILIERLTGFISSLFSILENLHIIK